MLIHFLAIFVNPLADSVRYTKLYLSRLRDKPRVTRSVSHLQYAAYDFLFVLNSNHSSICFHYGDINDEIFQGQGCFGHFGGFDF